jgi:hypothetical protein
MAKTAKVSAPVGGAGMGMMDREGKYLTFEKWAFAADRPGSEFRENPLRPPRGQEGQIEYLESNDVP